MIHCFATKRILNCIEQFESVQKCKGDFHFTICQTVLFTVFVTASADQMVKKKKKPLSCLLQHK